MSRSGYSYELDDLELGRWRGQVSSALRGKRGQKLLADMLTALDAMPVKELFPHELESADGVCALGACGRFRGIDMSGLDPEEPESVAGAFNIATQMAQEIVFINDEVCRGETTKERWMAVRAWVVAHLRVTNA